MPKLFLRNITQTQKLFLYGFQSREDLNEEMKKCLEKVNYRLKDMDIIQHAGKVSDVPAGLIHYYIEEKSIEGKFFYKNYTEERQENYFVDPVKSLESAIKKLNNPPYILIIKENEELVKREEEQKTDYRKSKYSQYNKYKTESEIPEALKYSPKDRKTKEEDKTTISGPSKTTIREQKKQINMQQPDLFDQPAEEQKQTNATPAIAATIPVTEKREGARSKKKEKLNNTELHQKYLSILWKLHGQTQEGSAINIKKFCKEHSTDKKIFDVLLKEDILQISKNKRPRHYKWITTAPNAAMVERITRKIRTGRKKYLKTGIQHVKGWKKGNFEKEENDIFIDLIKKKTPYTVISAVLNRTTRLLQKQKYKLKKRGVDLTPYPDHSPTLFDPKIQTTETAIIKPVRVIPTEEALQQAKKRKKKGQDKEEERGIFCGERKIEDGRVKTTTFKDGEKISEETSELASKSAPTSSHSDKSEMLMREYYERLIKDKDKKCRLDELKPILKLLRSQDTTKEAIARYIEGRALEINGFISEKRKRIKQAGEKESAVDKD